MTLWSAWMNRNRLVIFDVDGTLLQTDRVTVPAVQRAFAAYNLPEPDRETICAFFGQSVAAYEEWLAQQCPADQAAEIVAATNALELRLIGEAGEVYPGTMETLEQLRAAGYQMAICSNGPEAYVQEFVEAHGVRSFFPVVYARGTRYAGKQEMVRLILDATAPDAFAVVGDRHDDIDAAHAWGGYGVAAAYGFGGPEERRAADAVIASITEAPACLDRLLGTPTSSSAGICL